MVPRVTTQRSTAADPLSPLDAAREVAPAVRAAADRIEQARRLPEDVVALLNDAGLFRLCVPRTLAGSEADPATIVATIETIAAADGSAGWCVAIGVTSGLLSGYLDETVARAIYAPPAAISGGVFAPKGAATAVDGGYRVNGRWPFASGCQHCAWLMGGSVVMEAGKPQLLANGAPDIRLMLFPAGDATIIDTWSVSGLTGTGSHDIAVENLFVPTERSVSLITDAPRSPRPLYVFPVFGLLAIGIAAVSLGIARTAIDELVALAGGKTPTGSRKRLADRAAVQTQVSEAEALLQSGRALLFDAIGAAWESACGTGAIGTADRARVRLAATHATRSAARAVDLMYDAGGGTSVYRASLLQRCFRDVHVATQHMMVSPATLELTGRIFLGIDADTSQL